MDFTYSGSGKIQFCGCSLIDSAFFITYLYSVGDVLCVCKQASQHGKIEKICIKRVEFVSDSFGITVVNYKDTFNRVWIEDELCTLEDGIELAEIYLEKQIALMRERECC